MAASGPDEATPSLLLFAEHALREAVESGLTPGECEGLLRGRTATDVVPPLPGEGLADYANRATSEFLVLYLISDSTDPVAPN
jgi:hypothetical protein